MSDSGGAEGTLRYDVLMTDEALYGLADVRPDRVYQRLGELIPALASFPRYGQAYDPYYVAACPPVPCRVFYCGPYGVYYTVDDEGRTVTVLAVEDERRDPRRRFCRDDFGL